MEPVNKQDKELAGQTKSKLQSEVDGFSVDKKIKKSNSFIKPLRTYKSDIADVLAKGKTSLVGIVSAEHKKRIEKLKKEPTPEKGKETHIIKNILITVLSIILIVLGAGSVTYFYLKKEKVDEVFIQEKNPALIFSENHKILDITNLSKRKLMNTLVNARDGTSGMLNTITNYIIAEEIEIDGVKDKTLVSAEDFLRTLEVHVPSSFLRALEPEFMFGVHVFDGNVPFFIFKVESYENAFAGMLDWEKTMETDLFPLFESETTIADRDSEGTTTLQIKIGFRDVIIRNKDTRVLENNMGRTIFLYSFLDRKTIVIAIDKDSFTEILTRIASTRTTR